METLTLEGAQEPQANAASPRLAYLSVMGPASADECYERNNTVQVADRARPLRPHKRNGSPTRPVYNLDEILVSCLFSPAFL